MIDSWRSSIIKNNYFLKLGHENSAPRNTSDLGFSRCATSPFSKILSHRKARKQNKRESKILKDAVVLASLGDSIELHVITCAIFIILWERDVERIMVRHTRRQM